jgi:hypothetical protein
MCYTCSEHVQCGLVGGVFGVFCAPAAIALDWAASGICAACSNEPQGAILRADLVGHVIAGDLDLGACQREFQ